MKKSANAPETISAYIAAFPADTGTRLKKIRAAISKAAPGAEQSISYRIPTFKLAGRPLLYFAAFKAHIGLYPITASVKEAFKKELAVYAQSKGTIRFPLDEPVPYALIGRIAKFRVRENGDAANSKGKTVSKPRAAKSSAVRKKKT